MVRDRGTHQSHTGCIIGNKGKDSFRRDQTHPPIGAAPHHAKGTRPVAPTFPFDQKHVREFCIGRQYGPVRWESFIGCFGNSRQTFLVKLGNITTWQGSNGIQPFISLHVHCRFKCRQNNIFRLPQQHGIDKGGSRQRIGKGQGRP